MNKVLIEDVIPGMKKIWELDEVLYEGETRYQKVMVAKTAQGLGLFCDNETQSTEHDQQIYHEGLIIPAFLVAQKPDRVLVIGSSEGVVPKMAAELGAREVVHVDIDKECVHLCAKYLPYGYTLEELKKAEEKQGPVEMVYDDGRKVVLDCCDKKETFDIIVLDLPDEDLYCRDRQRQHNRLYEVEFLNMLSKILSPGGALITHTGSPLYLRNRFLTKSLSTMSKVFKTVVYFEMVEHGWSFLVGTKQEIENQEKHLISQFRELKTKPTFIDELSIKASIILPRSIRAKL